jgi:uncharacterized RDD family membrane protein YckC
MKNIEIKTTQNVVLQYELADLRDRILAYVVDMVCILVGIWLVALVLGSIFSFYGTSENVLVILLVCIFIFYSLALEVFNNGQSLGKMAMRIQVIKMAGGHATFADYAARWVFRMIDIYFSIGGIACILIASSSRAQRIGDIVANTAVVKLVPKMNLRLKDLLTIHSQDSYTPIYNEAKQLIEEDVLLIKTTLDRYRQFPNGAHSEAMNMLAQRIKLVLRIEDSTQNDQKFLQTILQDYVVLTR